MVAAMPEQAARAPSEAPPALLRVAHVRRVHGIRGEMRVQSLGGDAARFRRGTAVQSERGRRKLRVRSARPFDGEELLMAFEGIETREEAAQLTGDYLCVVPAEARPLRADEWFVWQLVGLQAVSADGAELGSVIDVETHPASDVLVVRAAEGEERYPMVREWVREVDLSRGVIVLTPWPELSD